MALKKALFNIKGMTRDLAVSKFNPEFAYENRNMRIIATDSNTSGVLANERGNLKVDSGIFTSGIEGTPVGQATIDDELILFTAGENDNIYKMSFNSTGDLIGEKLYSGHLGFNVNNPIECISVYESDQLKKVYWTDGHNQPRVINVAATPAQRQKWVDDTFNFVRKLQLKEEVNIERNIVASGSFAPGVIQYVFTYYNLYGQESNIFYTSPLYYVSYNNRGASPEDTVSNSFTISLSFPDTNFEYIRVYSIHRSTIDAVPQVRKVVDLAVPNVEYPLWVGGTEYNEGDRVSYEGRAYICTVANDDQYFSSTHWKQEFIVTYTDDGNTGESVDPTMLLYVGGEDITVGTMEQKDNTLFLGDIKYNKLVIPKDLQETLKNYKPSFGQSVSVNVLGKSGGFYNYTSQLTYNSGVIKGFKYLEYYRFGLQFQYKTGKWSSPVWVGDVKNDRATPSSEMFSIFMSEPIPLIYKATAQTNIYNVELVQALINLGYTKVRPVVVYPSVTDRESVCQGILCPTVFNSEDRYGNAPFAQASWFARANAPCDIDKYTPIPGETSSKWRDYDIPFEASANSKAGALSLTDFTVHMSESSEDDIYMDLINKGSWPEFRHNTALPNSMKRNCEVQCMETSENPIIRKDEVMDYPYSQYWKSQCGEQFFVDQSILTFHSPDIEFDTEVRSLDSSNLKLRIVGTVPLTAFDSNIDIQTSTPPMSKEDGGVWQGFYSEPVNSENVKTQGWRSLISAPMWVDGCDALEHKPKNGEYGWMYAIYPWHRSGSLNNSTPDTSGNLSAKLSQKKLANTRFSYNTFYLHGGDIWYAYDDSTEELANTHTGITGVQIFDSNEITPVKLPAQDTGLPEIIYYGNVDKVVTYPTTKTHTAPWGGTDLLYGYQIMTSAYGSAESFSMHNMYLSYYEPINKGIVDGQISYNVTHKCRSTDPISMKYKSTPHAVLALKNTKDHYQRALPTFIDYDDYGGTTTIANSAAKTFEEKKHLFWDKNNSIAGVHQDICRVPEDGGTYVNAYYTSRYGFLWLAELYNDTVTDATRFGGQTEEAFENNQWHVAGDPVSLTFEDGQPKAYLTVNWTEGDTYFQRYDCLKTYPFTKEDTNSITEIVSFMCETRVNIDGRYDRNRGQSNNLYVSPENFNLINTVYSQDNNFFTYRATNLNKLLGNKFPNTVTWTKTKTLGEEVDTWTNITLASTLDLDGNLGSIRAIRRLNDTLLTFQDNGISQILYNENVQIASTAGVPIEIANSGKVSGKRYISNKVGCVNKWSICTTPSGMYFYDGMSKDLYLFNGEFNNLSDRLGFHSWVINNLNDAKVWNPKEFSNCITYYDKINNDVLFITKDDCLTFSEPLGQFSSFYDYGDTPFFAAIKDREIAIHKDPEGVYYPYLHHEGKYNEFYGVNKPYWTTVLVNLDPTEDKIFNNVEFRADSFDGQDTYIKDYTFDTLNVWNEHQAGTAKLVDVTDKPSSLKKKFRIWRANIPRWNISKNGQPANSRDRMRNPWLYLQLSMDNSDHLSTGYRTVLHDLIVDYFE